MGNLVKDRLRDGEVVVGCFSRSTDATFVEFLAAGGWDFLVLDGEHGLVSPDRVADLARACEVRGSVPIVRIPAQDPGTILRCLDAGAGGIQVPMVETAEAARGAVQSALYPPLGRRGLAGNRASGWKVTPEWSSDANESLVIVVQIETRRAVENIYELCAVDHVDVLFVGPTDLSQSFGVPGQIDHPSVAEAIEVVAGAVSRSNKAFGMFAASAEAAVKALELGATYVAASVESLLGGRMASYIERVRSP